jgi:PAS domain S-box-containing protein
MLIRSKLSMAFGAISVLACGAGAIAVLINSAVKSDVAQIIQCSVEKPKAAAGMAESLLNIELHRQELLAQRNPTTVEGISDQNVAKAVAEDVEHFEQHMAQCHDVDTRGVQLAVAQEDAEEIKAAKHDVALLGKIQEKFAQMKELLERQMAVTNPSLEASGAALLPVWKRQYEEITTLVQTYDLGADNQLSNEVRQIETSLSRANQTMLWSTLAILVVAGLLAWFISRTFSRPLNLLASAAHRIGEGELNTAVAFDSEDEFGLLAQAFNRMAADLQVSMDYVEGILKSMGNSLIVVQTDRTIKSVNDSTLKMLGYAESELIGQSLERVLQTQGASLQSMLDDAVQRGLNDVEFIYQTKAGLSVPVSFSASVLRDAAGATTGLVCVAQDISERKRSEDALEKTHKELLEASRQAGMAEVATGVLHNVGNVLNSVNIASSCVADSLRKSKAANLSKVVALLREHEKDLGDFFTNDPKGRQVPVYLAQLAEHLAGEQADALKELAQLQKNIEHIKDIVAMQQSYARVSGVTETLQISGLVEDALRMNASALTRHEVELVREYAEVPPVTVEKHKVLQVLVNLIRNAKYACGESNRMDKRLTVRVANGEGRIKIAISDNGVGIPAENLTRIFNHGFTTRKDGHGFGLHTGALAAKEMGGLLTVQSDGPGMGAAFTLELPLPNAGELT